MDKKIHSSSECGSLVNLERMIDEKENFILIHVSISVLPTWRNLFVPLFSNFYKQKNSITVLLLIYSPFYKSIDLYFNINTVGTISIVLL